MTPSRFRRCLVCLPLLLLPASVPAQLPVASCEFPDWTTYYNIAALGPIGQEFTAGADRMDFVELWLLELSSDPGGIDARVRIHAGSMEGEVLGESATVAILHEHFGVLRFPFAGALALTPGATYTLEIVRTDGTGTGVILSRDGNPCANTRGVLEGAPGEFLDFWFRVGWSEAVPVARGSWGRIKTLG